MSPLNLLEADALMIACATALVAGTVRGFTGFGGPAIMILVLSQFFAPGSVVIKVMLIDWVANLHLVRNARTHVDWRISIPLLIGTTLGLPIGIWVLMVAEPALLKKFIAVITGICAAIMLSGIRYRVSPSRAVTTLVGFGGGTVVGATFIALPIMIFLFAGPANTTTSRANAIVQGAVMSGVMLLFAVIAALVSWSDVWQSAVVGVVYLSTAAAGARMFAKANETLARRAVLVSLLLLSLIGILT